MGTKFTDAARAVAMHRDKEMTAAQIAQVMGVGAPTIYRAFRQQGYITPQMKEGRTRHQRMKARLYPRDPAPNQNPSTTLGPKALANIAAAAIPRIEPREPCPRCGVRGDIGCKHTGLGALGWSVG